MPDHEFDKALGEKARELRLQPSPAVWEGVAAQLQEKKRRRGAAWFLMAAAVAGLSLGGWWLAERHSPQEGHQQVVTTNPDQQAATTGSSATAKTAGENSNAADSRDVASNQPESINANSVTNSDAGTGSDAAGNAADNTTDNAVTKRRINNHNTTAYRSTVHNQMKSAAGITTGSATAKTSRKQQGNTGNTPGIDQSADNYGATILTENSVPRVPEAFAGQLPLQGKQSIAVQQPKSKTGNIRPGNLPATTISLKEKTNRKWQYSFEASAGVSTLNEQPFSGYKADQMEYQQNSSLASNGLAVIQRNPSEIKGGFSFQAKVLAHKPISSKLRLGTGIQYSYRSSQVKMGKVVDSTFALYNIGQDRILSALAYAGGTANKGKDFTNSYHYLEVPLELSWNIDRRKHWYFNNGVSLGYLVKSDALLYDKDGGVYYRDNDALNRWQAGFFSSIQYNINPKSDMQVALGPSIQYQLTPVDLTTDRKHLLHLGFSARLQWVRQSRGAMK
ncbi:outer membrane beta-barrel protein [Flavihumibacter petaseus]|uniref:Outer membrane protein beta-barrel domain-containing protein n=1 Tax=Flavihumibacter petaseus NBRC 106054 TaxID=1220578 RepID=A0A0E9N2S9_9BACT|nr:outer membrane beta-barrel protein [Flavihumibacter petaseus]GAO43645.1 hypothetical protein FPE01S_02_07510 [Flavihumibacter petaseus NBRC 106054]